MMNEMQLFCIHLHTSTPLVVQDCTCSFTMRPQMMMCISEGASCSAMASLSYHVAAII